LILKCNNETIQPDFQNEIKIECKENLQFIGLNNYLKWIINQTELDLKDSSEL